MEIRYTPELCTYMKEKKKEAMVVEVITSEHSDFEVTELYVHLSEEKQAKFFEEKKKYRVISAPVGKLLLPPYHLEYEEVITFYLKKYWIFPVIKQEGIHL